MADSAVPPPPADRTVGALGERAAIERIRARLPAAPAWVLVGIGDDAAVIEPDRNRADVVTTDALVEGVHFDRRFVPPGAIGHKALAVNLSDLAAMGAAPRAGLLSLVLPPSLAVADLDALIDELAALALRHHLVIVGGNIARSPGPLIVDVTLIGSVRRRQILTRGGAKPGDHLYVSGTIGAAEAGLALCQAAVGGANGVVAAPVPDDDGARPPEIQAALDECRARFLRPEPRVRLGMTVGRTRAASACVDLSDGLADAVRQVAASSGLGAAVDAGSVPIAAGARWWHERQGIDPLDAALSGGEDYELLMTVPPRRRRAFMAAARLAGIMVTRIGAMTAGRRIVLCRPDGRTDDLPQGFVHFR
jgi:thiamine-monophosphate kinase